MEKPKIICIVGPTATGKSDLAVKIAKDIGGEIISADSRQIYKGLNIGTGKITKKEMGGIPHHMIDVADPRKKFTVTKFVFKSKKIIDQIIKRRKVPIVTGGTGFYIDALINGVIFPDVKPDTKLRKELDKKNNSSLYLILKKLDGNRAKQIDPNNKRRLIRAIEIASKLGKIPPITSKKSEYDSLWLGIEVNRDQLKLFIHDRLLKRIKKGMIAEAKKLHSNGLTFKRMAELGLEYKYLAKFLNKEMTKNEMIQKLDTEIWRYAKRQITWFKKEKKINWIQRQKLGDVTKIILNFIKK